MPQNLPSVMTLQEMKTKLESLHATLARNGGRGVELAEEIDQLQAEIDVLEGRTPRATIDTLLT